MGNLNTMAFLWKEDCSSFSSCVCLEEEQSNNHSLCHGHVHADFSANLSDDDSSDDHLSSPSPRNDACCSSTIVNPLNIDNSTTTTVVMVESSRVEEDSLSHSPTTIPGGKNEMVDEMDHSESDSSISNQSVLTTISPTKDLMR